MATPLHPLLHRCYGAWDQAATVRGCPTSNPNHYIVQVERSGATITEVVCGTRAPVQPPEVSRVETVRGQLVQYRSRRDVSPRSPWRATGEFVSTSRRPARAAVCRAESSRTRVLTRRDPPLLVAQSSLRAPCSSSTARAAVTTPWRCPFHNGLPPPGARGSGLQIRYRLAADNRKEITLYRSGRSAGSAQLGRRPDRPVGRRRPVPTTTCDSPPRS